MTIVSCLVTGLAVGLSRPPPNPRPGPKLKHKPMMETVLSRRLVSGSNEARILRMFAEYRIRANGEGEPGDLELLRRPIVVDNQDDLNDIDFDNNKDDYNTADYKPKHRYSYTREFKLAAIEYYQIT